VLVDLDGLGVRGCTGDAVGLKIIGGREGFGVGLTGRLPMSSRVNLAKTSSFTSKSSSFF
jgi:hypothetical protein